MGERTTPAMNAKAVVEEWTSAMEGVTPGPWRPSRFGFQVVSDYPEPAWQSVVELTTVSRSEPDAEREMLTQQAIANWLARCSPAGIRSLLALIAQQADEIERLRGALQFYACDASRCDCEPGHEQADRVLCGYRAAAALSPVEKEKGHD